MSVYLPRFWSWELSRYCWHVFPITGHIFSKQASLIRLNLNRTFEHVFFYITPIWILFFRLRDRGRGLKSLVKVQSKRIHRNETLVEELLRYQLRSKFDSLSRLLSKRPPYLMPRYTININELKQKAKGRYCRDQSHSRTVLNSELYRRLFPFVRLNATSKQDYM